MLHASSCLGRTRLLVCLWTVKALVQCPVKKQTSGLSGPGFWLQFSGCSYLSELLYLHPVAGMASVLAAILASGLVKVCLRMKQYDYEVQCEPVRQPLQGSKRRSVHVACRHLGGLCL